MFGSSILDVLLAVVFTFLAISLAASAITEAIASVLKLRQGTLKQGIQALLNDPQFTGLAKSLYDHAMVNPLSNGIHLTTTPAYIDATNFATALTDVLSTANPGKDLAAVVSEIPDPQLQQTLQALLAKAGGNGAQFQVEVASWFDSAMDRLGGWYKRKTQLISFIAALVSAAAINADLFHVTTAVWSHPSKEDALTSAAQLGPQRFEAAMSALDKTGLIGWQGWAADPTNPTLSIGIMVLGWCLVAAASMFGAPFWFDTLQSIVSIRSTGDPPKSPPAT